jgi:hypothetical protein
MLYEKRLSILLTRVENIRLRSSEITCLKVKRERERERVEFVAKTI